MLSVRREAWFRSFVGFPAGVACLKLQQVQVSCRWGKGWAEQGRRRTLTNRGTYNHLISVVGPD